MCGTVVFTAFVTARGFVERKLERLALRWPSTVALAKGAYFWSCVDVNAGKVARYPMLMACWSVTSGGDPMAAWKKRTRSATVGSPMAELMACVGCGAMSIVQRRLVLLERVPWRMILFL